MGLSADEILLHGLLIFHTHGLFVAANFSLITSGKIIFLPKFDSDAVIEVLPQATTTMMGVSKFYTHLLDCPGFAPELNEQIRLFMSGSAPLLAETHVQFKHRTGHRILERYEMIKTNINTSNPYIGERRAGTVGAPLPDVELKIKDSPTGKTLPQDKIGIIEVCCPNTFIDYWQMPEKTVQELR